MNNRVLTEGPVTIVYLERKDRGRPHCLIIDTIDLPMLQDHNGSFYAIWRERSQSYYALGYHREPDAKYTAFYVHRYILQVTPNEIIDHENGNGLDCRRENMKVSSRYVTHRHTRGPNSNSTSGLRGVTWDSGAKKWRAQVQVGPREKKYLGLYTDKKSAGKAVQDFLTQLTYQKLALRE